MPPTATSATLSVARFSRFPDGRHRASSPHSGEAFREDHLLPALREHRRVTVELDGVHDYGAGFLDAAFGDLVRIHGFRGKELHERLKLASADQRRIRKIRQLIAAARPPSDTEPADVPYHRYDEGGLPHVHIHAPGVRRDADGTVTIPDVQRLHRCITTAIIRRRHRSLRAPEIRFLRSELGLDPDTLADMLGMDADALRQCERGSEPFAAAAAIVLRRLAAEKFRIEAPSATELARLPHIDEPPGDIHVYADVAGRYGCYGN